MRSESTPEVIAKAETFLREKPSVSYIQRKLGIGYNHAMELMDHFERAGIVSKPNSAGLRTILDTRGSVTSGGDVKEISRSTITAFLARAINRAAVSAVDSEFGLRVIKAEVTSFDNIVVDFEGGVALVLTGMPVTRAVADAN